MVPVSPAVLRQLRLKVEAVASKKSLPLADQTQCQVIKEDLLSETQK